MFIVTLLPSIFFQKVHAYTGNSYFNYLKVGLTSMLATSIKITLNGDYTLNGQTYSSGSILNLGISGTSITLDGLSQSEISLIPNNQSNLLTITSGPVSNKYMGSFLIKIYNAKLFIINTLDMENYLKGVVGYEMSDYFPLEALKAQAVAARNYALSKIGSEVSKGYDFDDTISYQVYKGYNASYTRVLNAVAATKGQVLLYNDKLVETLYSAWHGGISENSENVWGNTVPYLKSAEDTYENDPWPNGNKVLTNSQIQSILVTKGYFAATDTFIKLDLSSITTYASGRVSNINIVYKNEFGLIFTKSVALDSTRTFLSFPSNLYTVTYDLVKETYTFSGKGNGHGLGMSQIGAKNRATAGQAYDEILKFYYQNTYLQSLIPVNENPDVILPLTFTSFTKDTETIFQGELVNFSTTVAGDFNKEISYKFQVIKDGLEVFTRDYSTNSSLQYAPTLSGNYEINVFVKDSLSSKEYDDVKGLSFTVLSKDKISSFKSNKTEYLAGDNINLNVTGTLGSGSYLYKYAISKNGVIETTIDYSSAGSLQYKANTAGTYSITVYLKDVLSKNDFDAQNTLNVKVYSPKLSTITAAGSFYVGKALALNGRSTDSNTLGFSYRYAVYKNTTLVSESNFNKSSTFNFTTTVPGTYTVKVYGKDGLSSNAYDNMKQFNITINKKPLQLSTVPLKFGMRNNNVVSLQKALVKLGYKISDKSGYFGVQTKNQVIAFQISKKLTKDGIVGNGAYNALNEALIQKSGVKTLSY